MKLGPSLFINAVRTADPTDACQIDAWPSYDLVARFDDGVYSENSLQRYRTVCVCSLSSEPLHRRALEWSSLGTRDLSFRVGRIFRMTSSFQDISSAYLHQRLPRLPLVWVASLTRGAGRSVLLWLLHGSSMLPQHIRGIGRSIHSLILMNVCGL